MAWRPFSGPDDLRIMLALVYASPAKNLHVMDLPYRLSSWALDHPANTALWEDTDGQLLAWAVLQTPFWAIDYALHPRANADLHRQVIDWADHRAAEIKNTPGGLPSWYINVFADQINRQGDLEMAGFTCQTDMGDDSWSKVILQRPANMPLTTFNPPPGFTIRPLAGRREVEGYVDLHRAAFGSRNMTIDWRSRTLTHPNYAPELDLVAVEPEGGLIAFCICWLNREFGGVCGQVEPLGVHPDFRKLGLGQAILMEALRRLTKLGAQQIVIETDNYRNAALQLYESVGFRVVRDVWVFRKDYLSR